MTKIKDLATVAVDNAYTLFPVDLERYELQSCVSAFLNDPDFCRDRDWRLPLCDERITAWLRQTDSTLLRAAHSFWQVQHNASLPYRTGLLHDRARRCEATIRLWITDVRWTRASVACPEVLVHYLWQAVQLAFSHADAMLADVPKGRRKSK
jgi:hypothetical protein